MKSKLFLSAASAIVVALAALGPAHAQDAAKKPAVPAGETNPPGPAAKVTSTPEERAASRKARQAKMTEAEKKGEVAKAGETNPPGPAAKNKSTAEERAAARKERRAKMTAAEKKGELTKPGELAQPGK